MKLLIAGSMQATLRMGIYVVNCLIKYRADGDKQIIVGDNPNGIDALVCFTCRKIDLPFRVYGIDPQPRNGFAGLGYTQLSFTGSRREQFRQRDRYMVDLADSCLFVWNGTSRGTKAGYDYALSIGKDAVLWQPEGAKK